jgi:hypothetical protein
VQLSNNPGIKSMEDQQDTFSITEKRNRPKQDNKRGLKFTKFEPCQILNQEKITKTKCKTITLLQNNVLK